MSLIWIDTTTGTWGNAADLVFLEVTESECEEHLYNASDSEISEYGHSRGYRPTRIESDSEDGLVTQILYIE